MFSLRCLNEGVTPPNIKIKCGIKTQNARDIMKKINNKLGKLQDRKEEIVREINAKQRE